MIIERRSSWLELVKWHDGRQDSLMRLRPLLLGELMQQNIGVVIISSTFRKHCSPPPPPPPPGKDKQLTLTDAPRAHSSDLFMAATIAPASGSNGVPPNQKRPNQTLYCSNLPDKLQKDDLKRALYMLFLPYGPILDIVTLKTTKMRGQAHVLFRDVQASTQALRSLQGHEFFGKQMVKTVLRGIDRL